MSTYWKQLCKNSHTFAVLVSEICLKLLYQWSRATGTAKRWADASVCAGWTTVFGADTQSDRCCMVGPVVRSFVPNPMWLLQFLDFRDGGQCFVSDFTVHGCRAVRQGAGNSWTRKNWKGSGVENAVVWHEGKKWVLEWQSCVTSSLGALLGLKLLMK